MEDGKRLSPLKNTFRRRKQLERDLEHVTQEMYKRNLDLAETNQTLSLLRKIDTLVLDSHDDLQTLCQQISQSIAEANDYPLVALLTPSSGNYLKLTAFESPAFTQQPSNELINKIKISLNESWLTTRERTLYMELNKFSEPEIARKINLTEAKVHQLLLLTPVKSVYFSKLMARQKLVGLMVVGLYPVATDLIEKNKVFINRLSEVVGLAVDNKLLYEENQHVLERLQKTNAKLEQLDATKDEFISMASHQLRTPLTSVKGYLSMVIEGDAGKLNEMQGKLLNQAFVSSQRMVYLIADLLNVSRLRTGKLVIQASPTDLTQVAKGEVDQLKEAAKSKNLTLTYKKPTNFPTLTLDETKIRQVMMNLIDNAIYYTPSGGTVTVQLKSDKSNVYFTVKDSGIGVPKDEQAHMFSKFYRAKNAQRARPDGTGLGLFMAQKVVSAQGGSMLFESQEGQGSTFGFSFQTPKLIPKGQKS